MTDLEMTKRCAEKMGWKHYGLASKTVCYKVSVCAIIADNDKGGDQVFDPLHDDAQAMALVKRFNICIDQGRHDHCGASIRIMNTIYSATSPDLNRAIVECVAKLDN
jgi:hypothetical protein